MIPAGCVHVEDLDAAVAEMEALRDRYQSLADKQEIGSRAYAAFKQRQNAVQECINIMVEHGLY